MSSPEKPRLRFAPSPTGYLHVGGARTALFNWLFARHHGGTLLLRIEDTDVERNRPELVDGILDGLRWLGLDWDEGPVRQSARLEIYRAAAARLATAGAAYSCYCPPTQYPGADSAEPSDEGAAEPGKSLGILRCACRRLSPAERAEKESQGLAAATRFRVPDTGTTAFDDAIFGPREIQNDQIEDFVLLRSTGLPTYQLGAVVDDIEMRITHVIRGADHLSNTPKQVLIYRALGAAPPVFAHVPLILGADRTRLSKRHGATSVGSYAEEGFLPEAFRNFLALLGWSPGDDTEFIRTADLIRRFSLAAVSRTNAVFDRAKLEWFNTQYLQNLPVEDLLPAVEAQLRRAGLWQQDWATAKRDWFARTVHLLRPRTRLLPDFSTWARAFFADHFDYDPKAVEKFWRAPLAQRAAEGSGAERGRSDENQLRLPALLAKLADGLEALVEWNHDACDKVLRDLAAAEGLKAGLLINATRVAIVGQAVAPPLFDTMVAIGQQRIVSRIRRAVSVMAAHF